jgi:predicted kinase
MELFNKLYIALTSSSIAHNMRSIRENSPYHREENVWKHTLMTLDSYCVNIGPHRTQRMELITMTALLFHDAGKPLSRQEKYSDSRGNYQTFGGHEPVSARVFEDFMMTNPELMAELRFDSNEWRLIKWLIENHLPYDIKDNQKCRALITDCHSHGLGALQMFLDVLRSDARGRISDDHEAKLSKVEQWIAEFVTLEPLSYRIVEQPQPANHKIATFLIGPSGAGKSTYARQLATNAKIFSLDELRLEFYFTSGFKTSNNSKRDYALAWKYCTMEKSKEFDQFWRARFIGLMNAGHDLVIDNVNSTRKSRAFYVAELRKRNYFIVSMEFPIALSTVIERQLLRDDKEVPVESVTQQYYAISQPRVGSEVDEAYVIFDGNFQKSAAKHYKVVYNS